MSGRKRPMAPETPDSTPGPRRSGRTQHTPALKTLYDMKYHKMMEHTSSTRAKKLRHAHGDYSQLNDHLNDDEDPLSSVEPPQSSPPKKKSKKLDRMPPPPPPKPDNKRSHPSRPKMKKSSDAAAEQIDDGEADVPTFGSSPSKTPQLVPQHVFLESAYTNINPAASPASATDMGILTNPSGSGHNGYHHYHYSARIIVSADGDGAQRAEAWMKSQLSDSFVKRARRMMPNYVVASESLVNASVLPPIGNNVDIGTPANDEAENDPLSAVGGIHDESSDTVNNESGNAANDLEHDTTYANLDKEGGHSSNELSDDDVEAVSDEESGAGLSSDGPGPGPELKYEGQQLSQGHVSVGDFDSPPPDDSQLRGAEEFEDDSSSGHLNSSSPLRPSSNAARHTNATIATLPWHRSSQEPTPSLSTLSVSKFGVISHGEPSTINPSQLVRAAKTPQNSIPIFNDEFFQIGDARTASQMPALDNDQQENRNPRRASLFGNPK